MAYDLITPFLFWDDLLSSKPGKGSFIISRRRISELVARDPLLDLGLVKGLGNDRRTETSLIMLAGFGFYLEVYSEFTA